MNDTERARRASQLLAEISTSDGHTNRLKHELSRDCANLAAELGEEPTDEPEDYTENL